MAYNRGLHLLMDNIFYVDYIIIVFSHKEMYLIKTV